MVQQRGNEIFISDSTRKKREITMLKEEMFNLLYELKESRRFALCYWYQLKIPLSL